MDKERIVLNDELSVGIDKLDDNNYLLIFTFYEMGEHGVKVNKKKILEFKEMLNNVVYA